MAIDPSIPLQTKQVEIPNQLDLALKAGQLQSIGALSRERNLEAQQKQLELDKDRTYRQAVSDSMLEDPVTGQKALDPNTLVQKLSSSRFPDLAPKARFDFDQQKLQQLQKEHEIKGQLLLGIDSPETYAKNVKSGMDLGFGDISKYLGPYDPSPNSTFRKNLANAQLMSMSAKDQVEMQLKKSEGWSKVAEAQSKLADAGVLPPGSFTPGVMPGEEAKPAPKAKPAARSPQSTETPSGGLSDEDPATKLFQIPKSERAKAGESLDEYKKITKLAPQIVKAFDDAYKISRHGTADFDPTQENVDQQAFMALIGPTVKAVDNTVRMQIFKSIEDNMMPHPIKDRVNGLEISKARREATLRAYLQSIESGSLLKNSKINPEEYKSTSIAGAIDNMPVDVKLPNGKTGTIPRKNLQKAKDLHGAEEL